jgi:hypothetical protein
MSVAACPVPHDALLQRYVERGRDDPQGRAQEPGAAYTDCFTAQVPVAVTLRQLICAVYTSPAFRPERLVLSLATRRRIADADVVALADVRSDSFAVWRVEARRPDQILLRDKTGYTRSWLGVVAEATGTRLMFGSAILSQGGALPLWITAIMPLHSTYSRLLLGSARKRLL